MPTLSTERLEVRPLRASDLAACDLLMPDAAPEARRSWLAWQVAAYRELERLMQPPYGERAIELAETGELVGLVGLVPSMGPFGKLESWPRDPDSDAACRHLPAVGMYWMLDPAHRGRGYATEAAAAVVGFGFETLELARIVATTEHRNVASQAVMRRLGMRIETNPDPEPPWFQVVGILDR